MSARLRHIIVAFVLGALTTGTLAAAHRTVGYVRDEGIYFDASRRYAAWLARVAEEPARANTPKVRDRYLAVNHEHPALMKMLAGVSARVLAQPPSPGAAPVMPEGAAMRLPAQLMAGLGVALLYLAGVGWGGGATAGLLAAGWFITTPRVFFHAGLHTFDVPVAVALLWVALAYRRALTSAGWAIALGPLLGIAIAVKHNALFLPLILTAHWWCTLAWARLHDGRPIALRQWLPLPLCSMATLGPLTALAVWPWLWTHPIDRLRAYFEFHAQHNWYNMEFLGHNYNQPPMPVSYPFVLTWATVPTVLLILAVLGGLVMVARDLRRPPPAALGPAPREVEGSWARPLAPGWARLDGWLLVMLAVFPLALIAWPMTPIFGGTKHWISAYPFFALLAAAGWGWLWKHSGVGRLRRRWLAPAVLALVLGPGVLSTVRGHPYGLSQYAPLVGGPRGAARLGLARGFWGHALGGLLGEVSPHSRLFLHDLHPLVQKQYAREGRWPEGVEPAALTRAQQGLLFYEKHMASYEYALWESTGTTAPRALVTLHDVPLTALYARPTSP